MQRLAGGGLALGCAFLASNEYLKHGHGAMCAVPDANIAPRTLQYDVVVVGGGIIGLATANEVLRRYPGKKVAVVEKEGFVAAHQSNHNSGVIHAGMYYEPGSKMAECCVKGADMMYAYAEKNHIPYKRVGKLIVATTKEEDAIVQTLYDRGVANGVKGLSVLTGPQVRAIEPNVVCTSALDSPNTGIIDFGAVTRSLKADLEKQGGSVILNCEVTGLTEESGKVRITGFEQRQAGPAKQIKADNVITCGGLWMDKLGQMAGGAPDPKVLTFRGSYYQLKPEYMNIVKRNIYPVPTPGGGIPVGVHFTPTVNEERGPQMIIGPGACLCLKKEGYKFFDFSFSHVFDIVTNKGFWNFVLFNMGQATNEVINDASRIAFLAQARKLVPCINNDMIEPSFAGVMAQVFQQSGAPEKDYIFERGLLSGTTLALRNAPSPAATSSLALAEKLVDVAEEDFKWKSA
eukprot:TRINITY_DN8351_c0_g1_i1.p1 TRINITY_DN8351_c0_g1~~TRINITY_DN8351_c0_g1_i1.p1  ORF type:complete len:460 (+),score=157.00 TRINITY_DN8351_c0_g1_i1:42-1421(+)